VRLQNRKCAHGRLICAAGSNFLLRLKVQGVNRKYGRPIRR
jgi:hypothetical protein